jgi:hypothetical protein
VVGGTMNETYMYSLLGSWQGIVLVSIVAILAITVVVLVTKNFNKLQGLKISRDGIVFGTSEHDLTRDIPKIDKNTQLALFNLVANLRDLIRAAVVLRGGKGFQNTKAIKMLTVNMIVIPLIESINRNHLTSRLASKQRQAWLDQIGADIKIQFSVVKDYCDIDFDCDDMVKQAQELITSQFINRAIIILEEAVYEKKKLYLTLPDGQRKTELLAKCEKYLNGLED